MYMYIPVPCYRTSREAELDNDFEKLTAVLTKLLNQVKVNASKD